MSTPNPTFKAQDYQPTPGELQLFLEPVTRVEAKVCAEERREQAAKRRPGLEVQL